jgi:ketose-bisphosphate aldolase
MMDPVVRALRDTKCFGLVTVARLEWLKFEAGSPQAVYEEYQRIRDGSCVGLHLDHVPIIDEDNLRVDYRAIILDAIRLGYESVMVDGSRLPLEENIRATKEIVEIAHAAGIPVEGELGAVLGHEAGPLPPYEELWATGKGFTDPEEAKRFVAETGVDWLSVAVGNVHGAISGEARYAEKIKARLNIEHLKRLSETVNLPLVLHGGTGIKKEYVLAGIQHGIAKINIATAIRQPYEKMRPVSVSKAQEAVYAAAVRIITEDLEIEGSAGRINLPRQSV